MNTRKFKKGDKVWVVDGQGRCLPDGEREKFLKELAGMVTEQ